MGDQLTAQPVVGAVLAGGHGRRFGLVEKAFLTLAGRPLIEHVIERLAPQVGDLLINTNSDDVRFRAYGVRICADRPGSRPATGPLAGLSALFQLLQDLDQTCAPLLSVPVDTPLLPGDLVERLRCALVAGAAAAAYPASAGRDHPIVALWMPDARRRTLDLLAHEPDISLHRLMARLNGVRVTFAASPVDPFLNINCAEDLAAAECLLR